MLIGVSLFLEERRDADAKDRRERWIGRGFATLAILGTLAGLAVIAVLLISVAWGWGDRASQSIAARHIRAYGYYFAPVFDFPPETLEQLWTPIYSFGNVTSTSFGTTTSISGTRSFQLRFEFIW